MKLTATLFALAGCCLASFAQKNQLHQNTLQEITCYIEHPFEFLGKTDAAVIAAGRPAAIIGGNKWDADVTVSGGKNTADVSKVITIGTGCGVLLLMVSAKTGLVYSITFITHKKSKVDDTAILNSLKDKYPFDNRGHCVARTAGGEYLEIGLLKGGLMILALEEDWQRIRFE